MITIHLSLAFLAFVFSVIAAWGFGARWERPSIWLALSLSSFFLSLLIAR